MLVLLPVGPDVLDRVEFGSVSGQVLELNAALEAADRDPQYLARSV